MTHFPLVRILYAGNEKLILVFNIRSHVVVVASMMVNRKQSSMKVESSVWYWLKGKDNTGRSTVLSKSK